MTFTAATNSAPPGATLSISGRCGVDTTFGHGFADISLSPYDYLADNSVQWEMDPSGNFHGGFLIAPNTARGAHTFDVFCYVARTHAAAADLRGIPFSIAGATVNDFSIQAQPTSGGPGTHVTLRGTGCILDGIPLDEAHVTVDFQNPITRVALVAQVGPDGTWTTTFTVPANITQEGPALFQATCEAPGTHIGHFDSASIFTVDSIPPPTTTTTTTTMTTPTTSLATTPAPQQPALPRTG